MEEAAAGFGLFAAVGLIEDQGVEKFEKTFDKHM